MAKEERRQKEEERKQKEALIQQQKSIAKTLVATGMTEKVVAEMMNISLEELAKWLSEIQ